jgi:hypothetical protein
MVGENHLLVNSLECNVHTKRTYSLYLQGMQSFSFKILKKENIRKKSLRIEYKSG